LTGVCQLRLSSGWPVADTPELESFDLLLRDENDIQVLGAPSWWTAERLRTALTILGATLLAAIAWGTILRQQVSEKTRQLAVEMRSRRDANLEFEATLKERKRLATDLHDTIEQSLTGVALRIEAIVANPDLASTNSRSLDLLGQLRQLVAKVREDVHQTVWNMRTQDLENYRLLPDAIGHTEAHLLPDESVKFWLTRTER